MIILKSLAQPESVKMTTFPLEVLEEFIKSMPWVFWVLWMGTVIGRITFIGGVWVESYQNGGKSSSVSGTQIA